MGTICKVTGLWEPRSVDQCYLANWLWFVDSRELSILISSFTILLSINYNWNPQGSLLAERVTLAFLQYYGSHRFDLIVNPFPFTVHSSQSPVFSSSSL